MADLRYLIDFTSNTLGLDRATSAVGKLGAVLAAVGVGVAAVKLKNFFSDAIEGAAEFEQQLATVQAVSGSTAEEMGRIKLASEDLGKSTRYNSTQAAEGFEILARAGLSVDESLSTIPSVLSLAQGNALDLGEAAGFVTKAVQGMGLSFDDSGRVADVLAKAAASANTDVRGLGSALSYAAPSAAALGLSLEDTVAFLGVFADAGIDASRAGTALNGMLSQFGNSGSKFKRELVAAGITTNDFGEAIRQLAEKGADGEKAINALGLEAGPALKALISQGVPALDELTAKLQGAGGTAEEQADIMNSTWQGALAGLGSAWQSLKDKLGESFLDSMTESFKELGTTITGLVDSGKIKQLGDSAAEAFKDASKFAIEFVQNVDMADVIDKVSKSFESLQTIATGLNGGFQALNIGFQAVKSGLLAIGVAVSMVLTIAVEVHKFFVDAGRSIANFFGLSSKAIDGYSESLGGALQASEDFRGFADEEMAKASESINKSFKSIAGVADETAKSTEESGGTIAEIFKGISESAYEGAQETSASLKEIRDNTNEMIEDFGDAEQFAALLESIVETGQEATVGSEIMNRLIIGAGDLAGAHRVVVEKAKESMKELGMTTEDAAEKTRQAIDATFSGLDIDVAQSLNGVNSKTQETFDMIATGSKNVADSTYSATEKAKLLAALFEKGLNAAKTKEEFKELNEVIKHNGLSSAATAEQQQVLQAGMQGGADAANKAADATDKQTQALDYNTDAVGKNMGATSSHTSTVRENTSAREESSIATWNASFATDENAKSESSSLAIMQQATAGIKDKISALNQLSGTADTTDESYNKLMKSMGFYEGYKWLSLADYARDMERVQAAVDKQAESYSEKNNKSKRNKSSNYASDTMPEPRQQAPTNTSAPKDTIRVELVTSAGQVDADIPLNQKSVFEAFVKQLQESKALAGQ